MLWIRLRDFVVWIVLSVAVMRSGLQSMFVHGLGYWLGFYRR